MKKISKHLYTFVFIAVVLGLLASCSVTKKLEDYETLFLGSKVKVLGDDWDYWERKEIELMLDGVTYPKPNKAFPQLSFYGYKVKGPKVRLWVHNNVKEPKREYWSLRYWVRDKYGEDPVLLSDVYIGQVKKRMVKKLAYNGYFNAEVEHKLVRRKKNKQKAFVVYQVSLSPAYRIRKLHYPERKDNLTLLLWNSKKNSAIVQGERYQLASLTQERERLNSILRESGYFYFKPDYLVYKLDTTVGNSEMEVYLQLKQDIPLAARTKYQLNNIVVRPDYDGTKRKDLDTLRINNIVYVQKEQPVKEKFITNSILLDKGQTYSYEKHNRTLKNLMSLGVYKFAKVNFEPVPNTPNLLDGEISLTPHKKRYARAEFNAVTKNTGFAGPGISLSLNNRNLFGGAERFSLKLDGGLENHFGRNSAQEDYLGINSFEYGIEASLIWPRFIAPFVKLKPFKTSLPLTKASTEYRNLVDVRYYKMQSSSGTFGYVWQPNSFLRHDINLVNINHLKLIDTTAQFAELLGVNALLSRSFEEQLLLGTNYSYTYTGVKKAERSGYNYFNCLLDVSGDLFNDNQNINLKTERLVKEVYLKGSVDFRHYHQVKKDQLFVSRIFVGVSRAMGNDGAVMPFIKQFYIGGANSVRAFPIRTLGPGILAAQDTTGAGATMEQVGDIKLELNLEHRILTITGLELALFADMGNIWLWDNAPLNSYLLPMASLHKGGLVGQVVNGMAVGAGLGFRYDTGFFVVRLDFGVPITYPGVAGWERRNLKETRLNLAIGYPF